MRVIRIAPRQHGHLIPAGTIKVQMYAVSHYMYSSAVAVSKIQTGFDAKILLAVANLRRLCRRGRLFEPNDSAKQDGDANGAARRDAR
jgi:hypothetical protein